MKKLELQLFFGIMAYKPMTFLEEPLKTEYKYKIMSIVEEQMSRREYDDYTKYYLYFGYRSLDSELKRFVKANKEKLSEDNLLFIRKLLNLARNTKRFLWTQKTKMFPACFSALTTDGLRDFTIDYGRTHAIKTEPYVLMLQDNTYIEMAEKLQEEALEYYKNKN